MIRYLLLLNRNHMIMHIRIYGKEFVSKNIFNKNVVNVKKVKDWIAQQMFYSRY